jgi:hypothetical protein
MTVEKFEELEKLLQRKMRLERIIDESETPGWGTLVKVVLASDQQLRNAFLDWAAAELDKVEEEFRNA